MKLILSDVAVVRTGVVTSRIKTDKGKGKPTEYQLLNLKSVDDSGYINIDDTEIFSTSEEIKEEFFTQRKDILLRLSAPYTAVFINNGNTCKLLIPSHYAIIRVDAEKAVPEYIYWLLKRDKNRIRIMQSSSGSTAFGTISSGTIANLQIRELPKDRQKIIGELLLLSEKEQNLLKRLREEKEKYYKAKLDEIYNGIKGERK